MSDLANAARKRAETVRELLRLRYARSAVSVLVSSHPDVVEVVAYGTTLHLEPTEADIKQLGEYVAAVDFLVGHRRKCPSCGQEMPSESERA